jgi:hypothetical protein
MTAAYCLQYQPVDLAGTLVRQTYPGPPDYKSLPKGDKPQVIWVLLLDRFICVVDPDPRYPREYGENEVQLVLEADQYEQYRDLLGKKVIVSGELLPGGAAAGYHKRLRIVASEINRARVTSRRAYEIASRNKG